MITIEQILQLFRQGIDDYHRFDDIDHPIDNPFEEPSIEWLLYNKVWIDTVQWHLEDLIRNPRIDPVEALALKRRIDQSNQERTDLVERIDEYFWMLFRQVEPLATATLNTESPAWAIDRLSILQLKIYHMKTEVERPGTDASHRASCESKLQVLHQQNTDLSTALAQLFESYKRGEKVMRMYKQMKMYNDPNLNPVLYGQRQA